MSNLLKSILFCVFHFFIISNALAQNNFWVFEQEKSVNQRGERSIIPKIYQVAKLNINSFEKAFAQIPEGKTTDVENSIYILTLPLPDGTFGRFKLVETSIMSADLAKQLPNFKTFTGKGIDDPTATLKADWTSKGFHALIISSKGSIYIDPYSKGDIENYLVYWKKDFDFSKKRSEHKGCLINETPKNLLEKYKQKAQRNQAKDKKNENIAARPSGTQLRNYRIAVAATGEYTQFHNDGNSANGSAIADAQAAILTTINRVAGVYEREVAITFTLVNNTSIIYDDGSTDPFNNIDAGELIDQSQSIIDGSVGNANYDIGHTFSTGGGGLAGLGVVCLTGNKASGITGSGTPVGDPFDIDYVAHEVGHQFGGFHSHNGCGNSNFGAEYEPGSGTTIMAYAGICGPDNIQNNSDDYFHTISYDNIIAYSVDEDGNSCPVKTNTGNNPPVVNAGVGGFFIPIQTPFELTGSATDADASASLTYCWEQFDLGPGGSPNSPQDNAPIFRSFKPVASPTRTFPKISDIISNTQTFGELLPTYSRDLTFRLTVRDNQTVGGVNYDEIAFEATETAGPFLVASPNTNLIWEGGSTQTITWDVANTNQAPVNCSKVNILLSTDGGFTYPITLASNVNNDGSQAIIVPSNFGTTTNTARVKIKAADNVFFDISNTNFTINPPSAPTFTFLVEPETQSVCSPANAVYQINLGSVLNFNAAVNFSVTGLPANAQALFAVNPLTPTASTSLTISNTIAIASGNYNLTITATSGSITKQIPITLIVANGLPIVATLTNPTNNETSISITPTLDWSDVASANFYELQVATNATFTNNLQTISNINSSNYSLSNALNDNTTYFWRVRANNTCGFGNYSAVFSFTTVGIVCRNYTSTNVPITISENGTPTITSTINIQENFKIQDLNVINLNGKHSWINDLDISLTSPTGKTILLFGGICDSENDFSLSLDDEAATSNLPCPPIGGGTYQPQGDLSDFDGEFSKGIWTLTVQDFVDDDGGQLNGWGLEICYENASNTPPTAANQTINVFEDANTAISFNDFNQVYVDTEPLSEIRISEIVLPTGASLTLSGIALSNNTVVSASALTNGNLRFQGATNAFGNNYASFKFEVNDGFVFSAAKYQMTINVTPVNDIPQVIVNEALRTFPQAEQYTLEKSLLESTDVEDVQAGLIYTITTKPTKGDLKLNNNILNNNATFTQADIDNNLLIYQPNNAAENINDNFGFRVKDSQNGTTDLKTFIISIDNNNPFGDEQINVFPNPSTDIFNITIDLPSTVKVKLQVIDAIGKVVKEESVSKESGAFFYPLDLKYNAAGLYILKIETAKGNFIRKLVKQ